MASSNLEIVIQAKDEASAELQGVSNKMQSLADSSKDISKRFKDLGSSATKLGKSLALNLTAPIVGLGVGLIKSANSVSDAMDIIAAQTGATGETLDALKGSFEAVAKVVPQTFDEVAATVSALNVRLGFTGEELEKASKRMLDFAFIQGADAADTTRTLGRLIQALGLDVKDTALVMDKLTFAQQKTGISANTLAQLITEAGPAFNELGFDLDRSIALFAQFEKFGARPVEVVGSLGRAMSVMAREGVTDMNEAFATYIQRIKDAENEGAGALIAIELFGQRVGAKVANDIREGRFETEEFVKALQSVGGTVDDTRANMGGFSDSMAMLRNEVLILLAPLGDKLVEAFMSLRPLIEKTIKFVSKLVDGFNKLSPTTQKIIIGMIALLAVLGPAIFIFGKIASAIGVLIGMFSALVTVLPAIGIAVGAISLPIILITAGIIALGIVIWQFIKNWDTVIEVVKRVIDIFSSFGEFIKAVVIDGDTLNDWLTYIPEPLRGVVKAVGEVINFFRSLILWIGAVISDGDLLNDWITHLPKSFENAVKWFTELLKTLKSAWEFTWLFIKEYVATIIGLIVGLILTALDIFIPNWQEKLETVKTIFVEAWDFMSKFLDKTWDTMSGVIENETTQITSDWVVFAETTEGVWTRLWTVIEEVLKSVLSAIKNFLRPALEAISGMWTSIWNGVKNVFFDVWDAIAAKVNSVVNLIKSKVQEAQSLVSSIAQTISAPISGLAGAVSGIISRGREVTGFADGGIVTKPTLGLVGEAGPEAIIPLNKLGGGGRGLAVTVNVSNNTILGSDPSDIAEQIGDAIFAKLNMQLRI